MNVANVQNISSPPRDIRWLIGASLILIAIIGATGLYDIGIFYVERGYDVNRHAYGRVGHAADEAEVRSRVQQVVEWWYNPSRPGNNDLYVGLAGAGPTATIFYNATHNVVNTVYYETTIVAARSQVHRKGYTQLVTASPVP